MRVAAAALALALGAADPVGAEPAEQSPRQPLALDEVLASVDAHYPLLDAARRERDIARGALRAAEGGFDTRLVGIGDVRELGFYESYTGEGMLEQNTRLWGTRFFGGYRLGRGEFPSYDGARQTDRDGEFRAGFELPLLRGRSIDEARARLQRAEIDVRRAGPQIELERIDFERDASVAYWNWLAAGLRVEVSRQLLDVAAQRQDQLERRVTRGVVPRIDLVDNERLIVDRRIRLLGAERDAEQASLGLSLFLRDADGNPEVPGRDRLPEDFPPEEPPDRIPLGPDLERATRSHPLLRNLSLQRERTEVALDLARNDVLPDMDLLVEGSRDTGQPDPGISTEGSIEGDPRSDTEVRARIRLELPIQRRDARGRVAIAQAELSRLESRERFARERIEADIRRALTGVEAAYAQTEAARDNLELALRLRSAEERKLLLGTSNLIDVNIREVQAADAAVMLIRTQAAYYRALANYRAAVGS